ncbi:hypothetical protein GCM10010972_29560 [Cellulomonas carbonis]|nr:hypothetical protein GCM10010972_29560 [Cellulomonas carbonis]
MTCSRAYGSCRADGAEAGRRNGLTLREPREHGVVQRALNLGAGSRPGNGAFVVAPQIDATRGVTDVHLPATRRNLVSSLVYLDDGQNKEMGDDDSRTEHRCARDAA